MMNEFEYELERAAYQNAYNAALKEIGELKYEIKVKENELNEFKDKYSKSIILLKTLVDMAWGKESK